MYRKFAILLFDLRFLFYGMMFGAIMGLFGVGTVVTLTALTVALPLIFWSDMKYIKPLRKLL